MKREFHIHVYEISAMAEISVTVSTAEEANQRALTLADDGVLIFKETDNQHIALSFEGIGHG